MSKKSDLKYRCGDCGKKWSQNEKSCSKCGSTRKVAPVFAEGRSAIRAGIKGKFQSQPRKQKPDKEFKSVSKLSDEGKEAREYYEIDRKGNRYFHTVTEQDENGNWVEKHREDEY